MIESVMRQLIYANPPTYSRYPQYRDYLRSASQYACAYCTITESENPGATFNIEHFRPEALFPSLKATCQNLRYSCPRCNSYKSDHWITIDDGCIRNCEKCDQKACKNNIDRFIDVLSEDPTAMLYLGEDNKLHAFSGSKPADYTIKYLRLNREQLIKLRYVRRFMDSWQEDLIAKKKDAVEKLARIKEEQKSFLEQDIIASTQREQQCLEAMKTMYEMLVLTAEQSLFQIEQEIERLGKLMTYRTGNDSKIDA